MEQATTIQMQIRENTNELNDFLQDLNRWEEKIKHDDEDLRISRRIDEQLPPIRKGKKAKLVGIEDNNNNNKDKEHNVANKKKMKIKSYDYDAWSKFDVDAACAEVENDGTTGKSSRENTEDEDEDDVEMEKIAEERKLQKAAMEKDKGNQLFKEGKFEAAINRYTVAIGLHSTNPIFYANRGMALLKMERYGAAEQDCTFALELDPEYTKALLRRATARQKLRKFKQALEDYRSVLKYEPNNKQATSEIQVVEKILKKAKDQQHNDTKRPKEEIAASQTKLIKEKEAQEKKKKRSNKPLKRIYIQEIGGSDDENEDEDEGKKHKATTSLPVLKQNNDRVPPLHKDPDFIVEAVPCVPTSSFMFETEFKRLKNHGEQFYSYLKIIPCEEYGKLFRQCIDSLISTFLQTLRTFYKRDNLVIHNAIENFAKVERFNMAIMFLSSQDKQAIQDLVVYMTSSEYPEKLPDGKIIELKRIYNIKS